MQVNQQVMKVLITVGIILVSVLFPAENCAQIAGYNHSLSRMQVLSPNIKKQEGNASYNTPLIVFKSDSLDLNCAISLEKTIELQSRKPHTSVSMVDRSMGMLTDMISSHPINGDISSDKNTGYQGNCLKRISVDLSKVSEASIAGNATYSGRNLAE